MTLARPPRWMAPPLPVGYLPDLLADVPRPRVLEIGGRKVTPNPWQAPAHWERLGVDAIAGPGVDLVADAHSLSRRLPAGSFDAVYSHAVFEHLAMPWVVAQQIARLLRVGGLAWIVTHEAFPVHEWPSDFWRFGPASWEALFPPALGLQILGSRPLQPARVIPDAEPGRAFAGHLGCEVQLRKLAEPDPALSWDVDPATLLRAARVYPGRARHVLDRGRRGVARVLRAAGWRPTARRSADDPWRITRAGPRWTILAGPAARHLPADARPWRGSLAASLAGVPDGSLPSLALLDLLQRERHPWAALAHARRVLAPGGLLFVDTCQVAPADEPLWRMSSAALPVLLHARTGFRLLRRAMLDPCHLIGEGVTGREIQRAYRRTLGLARAEGAWDPALRWDA